MLTGHAFNAMLKTLEEPPEYLKFVLATTDPQKVPVTVLSRCLQFNLRPMAPETVHGHLAHVLEAEGVAADAHALRLIARAARGSMRDALSLTDQAIAFGGGRIEEAAVRQMLGSVDRSHVIRLIEALAQGDGKTVVEVSDRLRELGLSAGSTLEEMCAVLQRMAVIQAVPDAADDGDDETARVAQLAQAMPADETQLLYSMCLNGRAELGLAADEYAALTMVLLRLLAFKAPAPVRSADTSGAAAVQKVRSADMHEAPGVRPTEKKTLNEPPAPRVAPPPGRVLPVVEARPQRVQPTARPVPANGRPAGDVVGVPVRVQSESPRDAAMAPPATDYTPTPDGDFWLATVKELVAREAVTALVRELALQSQLVARDEGHWMLRVDRESLNQPASRERLQAALRAAGHDVQLSVEVGVVSDSPARRNAAAAQARQRAAEEIILKDPFVQDMMRDFGAKIVPGSIKPN
jgi:DNA polymerase-3 subunit gamma/tau